MFWDLRSIATLFIIAPKIFMIISKLCLLKISIMTYSLFFYSILTNTIVLNSYSSMYELSYFSHYIIFGFMDSL